MTKVNFQKTGKGTVKKMSLQTTAEIVGTVRHDVVQYLIKDGWTTQNILWGNDKHIVYR